MTDNFINSNNSNNDSVYFTSNYTSPHSINSLQHNQVASSAAVAAVMNPTTVFQSSVSTISSPLSLAAATKQPVNKLAFSNQHIIDSIPSIFSFKNANEILKENNQEDIQININSDKKIDDNTTTTTTTTITNNNNNNNDNQLDASNNVIELSNSANFASNLTVHTVTDKTNNNQEKTSNNNIGHNVNANDFYSNNKSLLMSLHQNEIKKNNLNYRPLFQPFILFQQKPQSNINLQQVSHQQQQQEQNSSISNTIAAATNCSLANANTSATTFNNTASSGSSLALNTNCNQQQQQYFEQSKLQLQNLNTHFQYRINEDNLITKSSYQLKRNQLYFKPY